MKKAKCKNKRGRENKRDRTDEAEDESSFGNAGGYYFAILKRGKVCRGVSS